MLTVRRGTLERRDTANQPETTNVPLIDSHLKNLGTPRPDRKGRSDKAPVEEGGGNGVFRHVLALLPCALFLVLVVEWAAFVILHFVHVMCPLFSIILSFAFMPWFGLSPL